MKSLKYFLIAAALALIIPACSYAQETIRGTLFDRNTNEPLEGASISVPGTTLGTSTNFRGEFFLQSDKQIDSLRISYVGYTGLKIAVGSQTHLKIGLQKSQTSLNQMIISASRNATARADAPMAISTISSTNIKDTKATQLDQLLNQSAGVYMVDLGNEQHTMSIRQPLGYNDYYLYMEDGIPIRPTGDFNHNGLIEINSEATERIEVIKGPASSIYGSEAVGGAINFITKKPTLTPEGNLEVLKGSRDYKRANLDASATIKDKLGLYVGGYYANRSSAEDIHDDYHKYALNGRADYSFNKTTSLTATYAYIDYFADMSGDLDSAQFYDKSFTRHPVSNQRFTDRTVKATRAKVTLNHHWTENSQTDFTLYYRKNSIGQIPSYRIGYTADPNLATGEINENSFQSYGVLIQHNQKFKWLNARWIVGGNVDYTPQTYRAEFIWVKRNDNGVFYDYYFNDADSMLTDYSADLFNTALYTQLELRPAKKLRLVLGARYDRLGYHFKNHLSPSPTTGPADTTSSFSHFTPKIGATYNFGYGTGVYANFSVGFSPPNISSLYSGYSVPNLKPSTFYNYEVGGWFDLGNKGYVELAVYRLEGTDEVVSVRQPDGTSLSKNAGKTLHQGLELSVHYSPFRDVFFQAGGTYAQHKYLRFTDGKNDVSGNTMAGAPHYILNSKVTYKPHYFKGFRVSLEWQSLAKYYTDPENRFTYNGYNIFNTRAGYQYKGFEIWTNLLNFTNRVYATVVQYSYGSNSYTAGQLIRFQAGIGYHFGK